MKILRALEINKAHGHDEISVRMLKLSVKSIVKPLSILFQNCIDTRTFPDTLKKPNIVPVYKKEDKHIVDNYRSVSLLLIFEKFLKELFSIQFWSILKRITYFILISLCSDLLILVNIASSQYCMKFINLLIVILTEKCQGYFLRYFNGI